MRKKREQQCAEREKEGKGSSNVQRERQNERWAAMCRERQKERERGSSNVQRESKGGVKHDGNPKQ